MNVIELLEREQEKPEVPVLRSGDTVRVHVKVVEGTRERIQVFEGVVIATRGSTGPRASFTVRRVTHNVGVERRFLLHSPRIDRIEVVRHGEVRRAKLYYLREKKGKAARIRERRGAATGAEATRRRGLEPGGEDIAASELEIPPAAAAEETQEVGGIDEQEAGVADAERHASAEAEPEPVEEFADA